MDALMLSRLQFGLATAFHFLFVPVTLGLSLLIAIMETMYVRTGNEMYKRMVKFWGKLFFINVALGVVTGITLEFQFGTNWSVYSEIVGDVFGSLLAIEATSSFFLESTFIAVWFFGWNILSKRMHCLAAWLVALGANMSGVWILLANSWMHHPVGFSMEQKTVGGKVIDVAVLDNFWAVAFNPYAIHQIIHTLFGSFVFAGFFVIGISAYHLLKKNEEKLFRKSLMSGLVFAAISLVISVVQGHEYASYIGQPDVQPAKLAAMEANWETPTDGPSPLTLIAIPDRENRRNSLELIQIPALLSLLTHHDLSTPCLGLNEFIEVDPETSEEIEYFPPVAVCFYTFRIMVAIGFLMVALLAYGLWKRKEIGSKNWYLRTMLFAIPLPLIAIQAGWLLTEIGRQPFIVYRTATFPGVLTANAYSPVVPEAEIWLSLIVMCTIYCRYRSHRIYAYSEVGEERGPEPAFRVRDRNEGGMTMDLATVMFLVWGLMWGIFFVLDGFDLGVACFVPFATKNENERKVLINSIGPFWDGNEVWLIAAGAFTFGAFPLAYAAMFSTLYTPLMLLLFGLIIRGVSIEFRGKFETYGNRATWDMLLAAGSFLTALLLGVTFANLFRGIEVQAGTSSVVDGATVHSLDGTAIVPQGVGSDGTPYYYKGILSLFNPYGLLGGLLFVVMFLTHGAAWLVAKTEGDIQRHMRSLATKYWFVWAIVAVAFLVFTYFETRLYENYLANPVLFIIPLIAVASLLAVPVFLYKGKEWWPWFASSLGVLFTGAFGVVGMYPNIFAFRHDGAVDADISLTVSNASSGESTLIIMLVVAGVILPLVIFYQQWAYRRFSHKVKHEDLLPGESY
ncbi:MAG: cytochrome d ubiquinol oxidase subunit II [Planctomycetota bacterium]|nr:cytochrome d ubiquinol oxidase subunit II [Planctomycetota bacterium]